MKKITPEEILEILASNGHTGFDTEGKFDIVANNIFSWVILPEISRRYCISIDNEDDFKNIKSIEELCVKLNSYIPEKEDSSEGITIIEQPYEVIIEQPQESIIHDILNYENQLSEITRNIKQNEQKVENLITNLKDGSSIQIKQNWLSVVKKSSIEEAFKTVYKDFSNAIKNCAQGLNTTNESLRLTLDLIKCIALVEKSIYEQLDEHAISDNEFKETFIQFCKEQGITDDAIKDLLECSFNKTHTISGKIKKMQNEIHQKITEIEQRQKLQDEDFNNLINDANHKLNSLISDFNAELDVKQRDLGAIIEERINQIKELEGNTIDSINTVSEKTEKSISQLSELTKTEISDVKSKLMETCTLTSDSITSAKQEMQEWAQDFRQTQSEQLQEQQESFNDKINVINSLNVKRLIWTAIISILTSSVITFAMIELL